MVRGESLGIQLFFEMPAIHARLHRDRAVDFIQFKQPVHTFQIHHHFAAQRNGTPEYA